MTRAIWPFICLYLALAQPVEAQHRPEIDTPSLPVNVNDAPDEQVERGDKGSNQNTGDHHRHRDADQPELHRPLWPDNFNRPKSQDEEQTETERRNTKAIEDTAYWTRWLFYATGTAALFSIVAAGLLYFTLKAAQKANAIARHFAEASVRAYISVTNVTACDIAENRHVKVTFDIANTGNSPATDISGFPWAYITSTDPAKITPQDSRFYITPLENLPAGAIRQSRVTALLNDGIHAPLRTRQLQDLATGRSKIVFGVTASYCDVFGNTHDIDLRYVLLFREVRDGCGRMTLISTS